MRKLGSFIIVSALLILAMACSGGGSGGGSATNALSGDWVDTNNDGIYDPYQSQSTWNQLNSYRSSSSESLLGPRLAYAMPQEQMMRGWGGDNHMAPAWMDANHDGIADYAQDQDMWHQYHQGTWYDNNGDGVNDNFPNSGRWSGGWR